MIKRIKTINFYIAKELAEFFEMAVAYPKDIIVLQEKIPPSKEEVRRYRLILNGNRQVSTFGELWTVKYEPSVTKSTALSLGGLHPHTDGSFLEEPPSRYTLSFIQNDLGGGGVSTFFSSISLKRTAFSSAVPPSRSPG